MLQIHSAERADALVGTLAERLRTPLPDPFTAEIVAVPTRGIERFITQRLAHALGTRPGREDGVCANVVFPSPGRLLFDAAARACELEPDLDPWRADRLIWALLETIEAAAGEPWLGPLARHLEAQPDRRLSRARALAALFDRYASARPALIQCWASGQEDHWQARLWRALRERVGSESPAERLPLACERIATEPDLLELPERITMFGLTRLAAAPLAVLCALAVRRDVLLLLPRACAAEGAPVNPLLISWGREQRGFWQQLSAHTGAASHLPAAVLPAAAAAAAPSLLRLLQRDIRENRAPPGAPLPGTDDRRPELDRRERSVRIHACHGHARQVEVLREAILHRLADDPTLEPRDVIVMCPDVEAFAPLIEASFGSGGQGVDGDEHDESQRRDPTRALQVRIADRSLRQANPLLSVIARLLELAGGRVRASEVLDLADTEPVRRRLRFDDDELAQIREWVAEASIHWGLDADARAPFRLEHVAAGTWAAG
ncbi:MAG: exodeoxyribonuclease V subunit gamma, partial [Solirubrobacteraceae bacterium]